MNRKRVFSILLLAVVCLTIFIIPLLPRDSHRPLYNAFFTLIIIAGAWSMDTHRRFFFTFAVSAIIVEWVAYSLQIGWLEDLAKIVLFLFFIVVVVGLIAQIAGTRRVTLRVIIEAITGYLLLGLVLALLVGIVNRHDRASYNFTAVDANEGDVLRNYSDTIYYGFVTYTTLGYGDMLPLTPTAKSLAIVTAVVGQMYLTVIIAMLVGKFLSYAQENR